MANEAKNEIVLFNSKDGSLSLPVSIEADTVWLSQVQMAELLGKDRTVIGGGEWRAKGAPFAVH